MLITGNEVGTSQQAQVTRRIVSGCFFTALLHPDG